MLATLGVVKRKIYRLTIDKIDHKRESSLSGGDGDRRWMLQDAARQALLQRCERHATARRRIY